MELIEYKDMYGVYHRIKDIRPSYKLFLNRKTGKVELFDTYFGGKCMVFDLPILPDVIDKINASRIENSRALLQEVEQKNCNLQLKSMQNAVDFAKYCIF